MNKVVCRFFFVLIIALATMSMWVVVAPVSAAETTIITVFNANPKTICELYISPTGDRVWTGEKLGNSVMTHWAQRFFRVSHGVYDLQARDCDNNVIQMKYRLVVDGRATWEIFDKRVRRVYFPDVESQTTAIIPIIEPEMNQRDSDWDHIPDIVDQCIWEKEIWNGIFDKDGCPDAVDDLVNFFTWDVGQFWSEKTTEKELPNTLVPLRTNYTWRSDQTAYYGLNNETIHISHLFQDEVVSKFGDHAAVTVIAHEWGHALQHAWGVFGQATSPIYIEQQADCLAGVYSRSAYNRGLISNNDVVESRELLAHIGEQRSNEFHLYSHGTSAERISIFNYGYYGGLDACAGYIPIQ